MKDKILKLCRRLKKCTLDDFTEFIGVDGENLESFAFVDLSKFE